MRVNLALVLGLGLATLITSAANAQPNLLQNGNLDRTQATEIVPGFFLPKPQVWLNIGTRVITGPYEDEMSSEPWAGPAPTPVTTDGNLNPPSPEGCGGPDCAVFFKAFSGNTATNGAATGHLQQDVNGVAGQRYLLRGWAGAEANFLGTAEFGLEFLNAANAVLAGSTTLNLNTNGLFTVNGQPFNYKLYSLTATAPAGTAKVRARASILNGLSNPIGGGQAFVVDDFTLQAVPEPTTLVCSLLAVMMTLGLVRRR